MLTRRVKFLALLVLVVSLAITMTGCYGNGVVETEPTYYDLSIGVEGEGATEQEPGTHEYEDETPV